MPHSESKEAADALVDARSRVLRALLRLALHRGRIAESATERDVFDDVSADLAYAADALAEVTKDLGGDAHEGGEP